MSMSNIPIYILAYSIGTYFLTYWLSQFPEDCKFITRIIQYAPMMVLLFPQEIELRFPSWEYLFCLYFKKKTFPKLTKWFGIKSKSYLHHKKYEGEKILESIIDIRGGSAIIRNSFDIQRLYDIHVDMDLIYGENDRLAPHFLAKQFQEKFPHLYKNVYILPNENHLLFFSQPGVENLNRLIFTNILH